MSEETEVIEGTATELVEYENQQVETHQPSQAVGGLFNTTDPTEVIERATRAADALMGVVRQKGLASNIQGKEYLQVEAWTTLGAMVGLSARTQWSRPIVVDGKNYGYEAAVEVVNAQGVVVGRSEAQCTRSERTWANRDDYALRSMAQTRAMGKALRMPLGFIAVLAGYEATPMEEMPANMVAGSGNTGMSGPRRSSTSATPPPDTTALLVKLQHALAKRKEPMWKETAVVEAANRQWGTSYEVLGDFSAQHLQFVLDAVPTN